MTGEHGELSYTEITEQLWQRCADGDSGTLCIATSGNQSARILFQEGRIVAVSLGNRKGLAAIAKLREVRSGRCSFHKEALMHEGSAEKMPATERILQYLAKGGVATSTTDTATSAVSLKMVKKVIEEEAAEFLGPMGPSLCAEYFEGAGDLRSKAGLLRVLSSVAAELNDIHLGEEFRRRVLARLITETGSA